MSWDAFELIGSHTEGAWIDDPENPGERVWMPPHAALSWRGTWQGRQYGDYIIFAPPDLLLGWVQIWEAAELLEEQARGTLRILVWDQLREAAGRILAGNGDA